MKENEKLPDSIHFNFDDFKILSSDGKNAFVEGYYFENDNDFICVIIMKNSFLKRILGKWLDRKATFYHNWDHEFCGVGYVYINTDNQKVTETGTFYLREPLDDDPDKNVKYIDVKGFTVNDFSALVVDMEHG